MPPEVPPTQHPDDPRRTRSDRPGLLTLSPFDNDGQYTRSHSSGPAARVAAMEGLSQPGDPASTIQGLGLMNLEHSLRSEHPMSARESTPAWRGRILSGKEDLAGGQVGAHGRASQVPMEDPRHEAAGSRRPGQMLVELPLPKARASTSFMPPPPPPFTFGAPRGTSLGPSQSLFPRLPRHQICLKSEGPWLLSFKSATSAALRVRSLSRVCRMWRIYPVSPLRTSIKIHCTD